MNKEIQSNVKGITLIVLLILAGVTIAMLTQAEANLNIEETIYTD